jgi:G3E family GTPase
MSFADDRQDALRMLLGIGQAAAGSPARRPGRQAVPFTVISGFLGAGKTTLLCRLLERQASRRIAVLVNDFGAVNIDAALIRRRTSETIEFANGCVCCGLAAGLGRVLADLMDAPRAPDAIVLEASGVAEPIGVTHVALSQPGLRLDGVITVVDAATITGLRRDSAAATTIDRQIAAADLVVMSKLDLLGSAEAAAARAEVLAVAPSARIIDGRDGDVDPDVVLGLGGKRRAVAAAEQKHETPFRSWTVALQGCLDRRRLRVLMESLPASVFRAKGFVRLVDKPATDLLLQVVGRRWSLTPEDEPASAQPSQVVFIGAPTDAEIADVTEAARACVVPRADRG